MANLDSDDEQADIDPSLAEQHSRVDNFLYAKFDSDQQLNHIKGM